MTRSKTKAEANTEDLQAEREKIADAAREISFYERKCILDIENISEVLSEKMVLLALEEDNAEPVEVEALKKKLLDLEQETDKFIPMLKNALEERDFKFLTALRKAKIERELSGQEA